jgi:hypothetical protein
VAKSNRGLIFVEGAEKRSITGEASEKSNRGRVHGLFMTTLRKNFKTLFKYSSIGIAAFARVDTAL